MNSREAEESLAVIRTMMLRRTRYTLLSGNAGIAAGLIALAGAALRFYAGTPFDATWMVVFASAAASSVFFTWQMARAARQPFWTPQAETALLALMPSLVAAAVLTLALSGAGRRDMLPGVWMLLWGVGALSMSFFTPPVLRTLGISFLAAGSFALAYPGLHDALLMTGSFGLLHLLFGAAVCLSPAREDEMAGAAGR